MLCQFALARSGAHLCVCHCKGAVVGQSPSIVHVLSGLGLRPLFLFVCSYEPIIPLPALKLGCLSTPGIYQRVSLATKERLCGSGGPGVLGLPEPRVSGFDKLPKLTKPWYSSATASRCDSSTRTAELPVLACAVKFGLAERCSWRR
jgi:hypothetical protein